MPNRDFIDTSIYQTSDKDISKEQVEFWSNHHLESLSGTTGRDAKLLGMLETGGIPDSMKGGAYATLLKVAYPYQRDYRLALERTYGSVIPVNPVPPTFGGHIPAHGHALNAKGLLVVKHTLCILANDFPNLEFCPFLPGIVCLLAHHLTEDDLLGAINTIITQNMTTSGSPTSGKLSKSKKERWRFFPMSWDDTKQFHQAFGNLLAKETRKVYAKVIELHAKASKPLWADWLECFFIGVLPMEMLWRVLDSFVIEGYKTLMRFGLGLFVFGKSIIRNATNVDEILSTFRWDSKTLYLARLEKLLQFSNICIKDIDFDDKVVHHPSLTVSSGLLDVAKYKYQRGIPKFSSTKLNASNIFAVPMSHSVVKEEHWIALWSWIPPQKRMEAIELIFTTSEHGFYLPTLYERTKNRNGMILVVESDRSELFGAYLSTPWPSEFSDTRFSAGNGETFLFSLSPSAKMHPWVGRNNCSQTSLPDDASFFIKASRSSLTIGGGGGELGLYIDSNLNHGETGHCSTFANEPLTGRKGSGTRSFHIKTVQIFAWNQTN